ncbi:hypothetical protein B0T18DRAFT_390375 [Schizothecium vesticola]|uniref:Uncharacterized protein n=1 Tax=Schizothecium vesticola TaxID=314040 RepID=A0AA40K4Y3_9PEZI|nr:hypothetical protein B0T18DRAFT_390375 [Schizothecium vesticola]
MSSSGASSGRRTGPFEFLSTTWAMLFFAAVALQAVVCVALEAYVFAVFQTNLKQFRTGDSLAPNMESRYRTIPTFLALFIFGFIYVLALSWDALRRKNTIQIIGLCIANLVLFVYTLLQIDQINNSIEKLVDSGAFRSDAADSTVWHTTRPFLIATPVVIGVVTIAISFCAYQLYREFAWDILKQIGADYRMKKRFLYYQIYIALLKFDFFFFLGFTVQFLVVVTGQTDAESGLTIAAIPVTIGILVFAAFFTKRENKFGMCLIILLDFAGLAYFFFKLVRIYQASHKQHYEAVRKSLTAFAVMTILLIILTITNAFICMNNFGEGLKDHLCKPHGRDVEKEDANSYQMQDQPPQLASRMTID